MGQEFSEIHSVYPESRSRPFMIKVVGQKLRAFDWSFVKGSAILSLGLAVARFLGLLFSLILARVLDPQDYGFIQYTITLAGVISIGVQPIVQHVLARFVSKYKDDQAQLDAYFTNTWLIIFVLLIGTLLIAFPVLYALNQLSLGLVIVFIGTMLFYTYYGLARGFLSNSRLLAAYLGSNAVQLIATLIMVYVLGSRSTLLALSIYGLSYLLPLLVLQLYAPFRVQFKPRLIQRSTILAITKFSAPVFVSHVCFIFYSAVDILFLEHSFGNATVGVYALSKTLSAAFSFVPMGITTLLMPKAAALRGRSHQRLLINVLTWNLMANGALLLVYALSYNLLVGKVFGVRYQVGPEVFIVVALGNIIYGVHTIISAVLVGIGNAKLETISLVIGVTVTVLAGVWLVPTYGMPGAALLTVIGSVVPMCVYIVIALFRMRPQPAVADQVV